jgi:hypothetical protein
MKKFFGTLIFLFFAATASADTTYVSGTIVSQTWTTAGSPYCLTGDVLVATLTIQPGVRVVALGNHVFEVAGVLTAVGTPLNAIFFTKADSAIGWRGIYFNRSSPSSELAFAIVERSTESGVYVDSCSPTIRNCTIRENRAEGGTVRMGAGLYVRGDLTVRGCLIESNVTNASGYFQASTSHGAGVYASGNLTLLDCKIKRNSAFAGSCYATGYARGAGVYAAGSLNLTRCIVDSNYANGGGGPGGFCWGVSEGAGVYVTGTGQLINCIITDNTSAAFVDRRCSGLYLGSGSVNIINCTIANNDNQGVAKASGVILVVNSILFSNVGVQIGSTDSVRYSNIQGGYSGVGNINQNPILVLRAPDTLMIVLGSPCVDAGDPDTQFNDSRLPPALGGLRNDMGAHGGPFNLGSGSTETSVAVFVSQGWNLISNPVTVTNDSVRALYPTSTFDYAYSFSGGYLQDYTMENGTGYWERFPSGIAQNVTGAAILRDTFNVVSGWNMVGTISNPVDTNTIVSIPLGLRASNWYGYGVTGYIPVTQLIPGQGYWVRTNGVGQFELANPLFESPSNGQLSRVNPADVLNTLTVTDSKNRSQTLFFGADANKSIRPWMYDMPPLPPAGAFDARIETSEGGSMVQTHHEESAEFTVAIQSDAYPVTVSWNVKDASYEMTAGAGSMQTMRGEGMMKISNSEVNRLFLKLTGNGQLPKEYALQQNYPNPFNPSTTIKYDLPKDSRVNLKLFNILGQEVATLVNEEQKGGYKSVEWNASNVASGVYLYRLQAGDFVQTKKMLLLK